MVKYLSLLLCVVILASCSDDDSTNNTQTDTFIQPKAGSFFKYDEYDTDTTESKRIPNSSDTTTETFAQTGITYMGKTNVSMVVSKRSSSPGDSNTLYVNYEANNDISLVDAEGLTSAKWATTPLASKTPVTTLLSSMKFLDPKSGELGDHTMSLTSSYIGNETMTYKSQTINVIKIKHVLTIALTLPSRTDTDVITSFTYYAPSLGYFVKKETLVRTNQNGEREVGSVSMLIDHQLK